MIWLFSFYNMIQRRYIMLILGCFFLWSGKVYAGAWTLKRGQLGVKFSLSYQKTDERYYSRITPCPLGHTCTRSGQRVPFAFDGESRFTGLFADVNYGLTDEIEFDLQIPFFDIAFTDDVNPLRPKTADIGDIRFGLRYRYLSSPVVSTLAIAAKAPTGFFNKDAEVVPIGDGQWDLEFMGEFGKSLWPAPAYLNLDLGYRIRFAPDIATSNRDPGNEFFFRGEGGYHLFNSLLFKIAVNGLYGAKFIQSNLAIQDSQRQVLYFESGVFWTIKKPLAFDASIQYTLSGKNFPAGAVYNVGLYYLFSLWSKSR